jgi:hypothetical protein
MVAPTLAAGSVIRVHGTGPLQGRDRAHLFVIAHVKENGDAVIIPICSEHLKCDRTYVISPHLSRIPISHDSYFAYYQTKIVVLRSYQNKIEAADIEFILQLTADELGPVLRGLVKSDDAPGFAIKALKE